MALKEHFELMASYNQWMNSKVYEAAGRLSVTDLARDRGAFFSSILGTLNHLVVGDTIWLKRFATHPSWATVLGEVTAFPDPVSLDQILFDDLESLSERRVWMDEQIINWIAGLSEGDLDHVLSYRNIKGIPADRRCSSLIFHFFNHQTHHRGQVTTLLSQADEDVGITDLLVLIPDQET